MHELYRENYYHDKRDFDIIIFRGENEYIIKTFVNRMIVDKFCKVFSSKTPDSSLITTPDLVFKTLITIAKKNIEQL